jgi:hypothetical protein
MPAAFYDFFRNIKFLPNNVTITADSTTDTAQIQAGTNIAFDVEDSTTTPGASTDKVIINGPEYDVFVPVTGALPGVGAAIRLERAALGTTSAITTDIEILSDPSSPILVDRIDGNTIRISSSSPTIPFSQEQIEDFSAALLTNGTHTEITVNYDDLGPTVSGNLDLAVTSTLQTVTNRGAATTNAVSITNATGSSNSTTGALKITGGLGVFENVNVGGNIATATGTVSATRLTSTIATGTSPFVVTSTTAVANLQAATASKWHTARTISLGGDLSGSVSVDGSGDVTLTATVVADSIALGTDTTGNYVATGAVSGNGLSGSASSEGATFTVSSNATATNTGDTIVFRDTNGDFAARVITGTTFTGNASTASLLQTARNINLVSFSGGADIVVEPYVESDESTNATRYITFVDSTTDGYQRLNEDSGLTYNPSTGVLTATSFSGSLSGSVTGGTISGTTITASDTVTLNAGAIEEVSLDVGGLAGAINLDAKTNSLFFYSGNATANWTINFRGDVSTTMNTYLAIGKSATVVLLANQGVTPFYPTAFTVDGVSVTPRWLGGAAPTSGNASGTDAYSFSIIKTAASTYTIIASQARYA